MPLQSPNLDDRSWDELIREAAARIRQVSPEWTDLTPGDPGMTLLDVFAFLTETLIYRLNQVPDKLFIEFLRLIGVRLQPPSAASVPLVFSRDRGVSGAIEIPRGTRVTLARPTPGAEAPIFATADAVTLADGEDEVVARAFHAELVQAEPAGTATGAPGFSVTVRRPPIIAPTGDPLDLVVGVEAGPGELEDGDPAIQHDDRVYRIWREVENFTDLGADRHAYIVDRMTGTIVFAPSARTQTERGRLTDEAGALAEVPAAGRDIRVWYRRGGGSDGNVAAGTLTTLKDPIAGVEVVNREPATGGRAAEALENALVRGPQELHTLSRAVTARDFQLVAERASGAVSRARAVTQAELWRYATPGTVEVFLVPNPPEGEDPALIGADRLVELQSPSALERVRTVLDERRPLGTSCVVDWVRFKTVRIQAEIVVHREEDRREVRDRVDRRLHATINPLATPHNAGGWPFGQSLFASSVYKVILSEPGVRYARGVKLIVDDIPGQAVRALAADPFERRTWYAGSDATLFRTINDGDGWESMTTFAGETIARIRSHPDRPGYVAAVTHIDEHSSRVSVSFDAGGTWSVGDPAGFRIEDAAWMDRDNAPLLLLATEVGLYQLAMTPGADPVQMQVDPSDPDMGFYAVATSREVRGEVSVAVAAREVRGVYLSSQGGAFETFRHIGLNGKDVRVLAVQVDGPNRYLWAGVAAAGGDDPGEGAHSWQLFGGQDPRERWRPWNAGWQGGSCWAIAFQGTRVVAGSHESGVLWLDTRAASPTWQPPTHESNLPFRRVGEFLPIDALAADPTGRYVMAGGAAGIWRTRDPAQPYEHVSEQAFDEEVTIPPTWLLSDGPNEIIVSVTDA